MAHGTMEWQSVRRYMTHLGMAALVVGVAMAFEYGRSMSYLHAVGLGLVSLVASLIFIAADKFRQDGAKIASGLAIAFGVLLMGVEYFTHLGYTVGHRVRDTQQTNAGNTVYSTVYDNLESDRTNLRGLQAALKSLQDVAPWAATVKADSMRGQVAVWDTEIALETARGGCKSKCALLMKQKADLEERIGSAEKAADYQTSIAKLQAVIDKKTKTATEQKFTSSTVVNQTNFVTQLVTRDIKPGEDATIWVQIGIGALISLVTTFLAPFCFFVAFRDGVKSNTRQVIESVTRALEPTPVGGAPSTTSTSNFVIANDDMAQNIQRIIRSAMQKQAA